MRNGVATAVPGSQWTDAEYAADLKVKRWVRDTLAAEGVDVLRFGVDSLAGHHMFDPRDRAECPGRFWRDEYRQRLFNDLTSTENDMASLNQDGSQRIVSEGNFIVFYNGNTPVLRVGASDGSGPGRISKKFGANWFWFRTLDDNDPPNWVAPYFSATEGD